MTTEALLRAAEAAHIAYQADLHCSIAFERIGAASQRRWIRAIRAALEDVRRGEMAGVQGAVARLEEVPW